MPRPDIRMTAAEIADFLDRTPAVVVAAVRRGGAEPVATVATARYADGHLHVDLAPDDPVAQAIVDGSPVCAIVERAPAYYEIKAVVVRGSAAPTGTAAVEPGRSTFRIDAAVVTSFDFGKIPRPAGGPGR